MPGRNRCPDANKSIFTAATIAGLILAGCSPATHLTVPENQASEQCAALFEQVDMHIDRAGTRDGGEYGIPGYHFLRLSRFDASLGRRIGAEKQFSLWIERLAESDRQARTIETGNLPDAGRRLGSDILERLDDCRRLLVNTQFTLPEQRKRLLAAAQVPDDYLTLNRVAGLYPISALFVSSGVKRWHEEERRTYATPLEKLPVTGKLSRWSSRKGSSLARQQVESILRRSVDALGTPVPTAKELAQLFDTFAPVWEVDVVDNNDRIGTPRWTSGLLGVDTAEPSLFRRVSYTRYRGRTLLQLNYIVWFPARDSGDMYGGDIDGINWRVTLDSDGTPLLFDSIHNCGCYQKFYPGNKIRLRSDFPDSYFETPIAPQAAPDGGPVVLRISHTNHFIQRVYSDNHPSALPLTVRDYDYLRSLPHGSGHRSMFDENGIVQQSRRGERYVLWPMGVRSAGAMRQWGRHNTAFVGKRHFDDPELIESLFEEAAP